VLVRTFPSFHVPPLSTLPKRRIILTALSFAAVLGVSIYSIAVWSSDGVAFGLPWHAHALALLAVAIEVGARALKLTWSGKSVQLRLPFLTSLRTCLAGDFGAAITPARSGSEPARYLVLAEAGIPTASALVVLFAELFLEAVSLAVVVLAVAIVFRHAGVVLGALLGVVGGYSAFVIGIGALAIILAKRNVGDAPPPWALRIGLREARWHVVHRWFARVRSTIDVVKHVDMRWATLALIASIVHVAVRLMVLPALVLTSAPAVSVAPLALWPLGLMYGVAVVPAPGGGGAVELAFRAALGHVIPAHLFVAALLWWRFYTFYIYIILGALAAGRTALRAVRKTGALEEELEYA
jgi:glycosyltransferase 2 family protein